MPRPGVRVFRGPRHLHTFGRRHLGGSATPTPSQRGSPTSASRSRAPGLQDVTGNPQPGCRAEGGGPGVAHSPQPSASARSPPSDSVAGKWREPRAKRVSLVLGLLSQHRRRTPGRRTRSHSFCGERHTGAFSIGSWDHETRTEQ